MRNEERVADIVRSTLTPLTERVLTKKLTQIIDVILSHDREKSRSEIAELRARVAELEAERAELVKDRERLAEVHAYLLGEAPMAGRWFGDDLPPKTPKFWWRKHLRQAIDAAREVV